MLDVPRRRRWGGDGDDGCGLRGLRRRRPSAYFSVVLSLSIALLALSNLAVFPALVKLRCSHPDVPRPFRDSRRDRSGAWLCSAARDRLGGHSPSSPYSGRDWACRDPDAALPDGFAGDRLGFVLAELVPLAVLLTAAFAFACFGRRFQQHASEVP